MFVEWQGEFSVKRGTNQQTGRHLDFQELLRTTDYSSNMARETGCNIGHSCCVHLLRESCFQEEIPLEEYEQFFQLVDNLLWDSEEEEGRQFRRGEGGRSR